MPPLVYTLMNLEKSIWLYNQHHSQDIDVFHEKKSFLVLFTINLYFLPCFPVPNHGSTFYHCKLDLSFLLFHLSGLTHLSVLVCPAVFLQCNVFEIHP